MLSLTALRRCPPSPLSSLSRASSAFSSPTPSSLRCRHIFIVDSRRHVHTQKRPLHMSKHNNTASLLNPTPTPPSPFQSETPQQQQETLIDPAAAPLALLPWSNLIRTYAMTSITSSPLLLRSCMKFLNVLINSKYALTDPDRNVLLRWVLMPTFYSQFCVGDNKPRVQRTVDRVKSIGFDGVILEYALEVMEEKSANSTEKVMSEDAEALREIETWRTGMIETINMARPGDFVALKISGLGKYALHLLMKNQPPTPTMQKAMDEVCEFAGKQGVGLLPGAEEEITNYGIDAWTLDLQKKFNPSIKTYNQCIKDGKPTPPLVIYTTYQAYLKSTPAKLAAQLVQARDEGFVMGVKLVRGAYLTSEPRDRIWDTKEGTDASYNGIVDALLKRTFGGIVVPEGDNAKVEGTMIPPVNLVLATHNRESVLQARQLRNHLLLTGAAEVGVKSDVEAGAAEEIRDVPPTVYAQLYGMADEVSFEFVLEAKQIRAKGPQEVDLAPRLYKNVTWGTLGQCLRFLLRRAAENGEAAGRTDDTRNAAAFELRRRLRGMVGLGI